LEVIAMTTPDSVRLKDETILAARLLLAGLFLVFGWDKLMDYPGTVAYMAQAGAPLPPLSAILAIGAELVGGAAIALGLATRQLALPMAVYTLATAVIGQAFWTMSGEAQYENAINFYKNLGIMGGFFLLYVTGGGRYALDAALATRLGARLKLKLA
jgi:putative oxidoreductase